MAESRISLQYLLEEEFKNSETQQQYSKSSQYFLEHNLGNRVFDEFQRLQKEEEFKSYCEQFKTLLLQINVAEDKSPPYRLTDLTQANIKAFVQEILKCACSDLLDEKGHIKKEIINRLGWEKFAKTQLKSDEIISAYLGGTNMQIISFHTDFIIANPIHFQGLAHYINTNYRRWVREKFCEMGFSSLLGEEAKEDSSHFYELLRLPLKKPIASAGIAAGAIALAYLGFNLFKNFQKKSDKTGITKAAQSQARP